MATLSTKKLLIASTNQGKISEVKAYLSSLPLSIVTLNEIKLPPHLHEIEETGDSFAANASIKAEAIGSYTHVLTLADDSGLVVDALNGRPGVFSHRYGNSDADRIKKLLAEMHDIPEFKRTARFECVVALYKPVGSYGEVIHFTGTVEGYITTTVQGKGGFGYDPIFYSPELRQTFAESSQAEKNQVSHRGRALSKLVDFLKTIVES